MAPNQLELYAAQGIVGRNPRVLVLKFLLGNAVWIISILTLAQEVVVGRM